MRQQLLEKFFKRLVLHKRLSLKMYLNFQISKKDTDHFYQSRSPECKSTVHEFTSSQTNAAGVRMTDTRRVQLFSIREAWNFFYPNVE